MIVFGMSMSTRSARPSLETAIVIPMFVIERPISWDQTVKKSRFLATAVPIASEREAREAIAAHSQPNANHNCWAWRVGQAYRFSDDGEPSGTAGKPILQAIDGQSLDNVVIIVTRWFGGVLLGTGGLVRAYGGTASACLRAASLIESVPLVEATIRTAFSDLALVKARLSALGGVKILDEHFLDFGAEIVVGLPEANAGEISRLIADLTSGRTSLIFKQ